MIFIKKFCGVREDLKFVTQAIKASVAINVSSNPYIELTLNYDF